MFFAVSNGLSVDVRKRTVLYFVLWQRLAIVASFVQGGEPSGGSSPMAVQEIHHHLMVMMKLFNLCQEYDNPNTCSLH